MSNHWQGVQQKYYEWISRRNTGRQWVQQLILQLFNVSWDLWEHRNGIRHNTPTAANLRELALLNGRIQQEFDTGDKNLLPRDKQWLSIPRERILSEYSTAQKEQWLASVDFARLRWTRRRDLAHIAMSRSRQLLRQWLGVPHPQP